MSIIIAYCIGAACILLPGIMAKVIAEVVHFVTKFKHGPMSTEQRQVRPIIACLVGVVIVCMTYAVQSRQA